MNVLSDLFGPLGLQYCDYFYYLSVFSFLMLAFTGGMTVKNLVTGVKVDNMVYIALMQAVVLYFVNRLFYSMCVAALDNRAGKHD